MHPSPSLPTSLTMDKSLNQQGHSRTDKPDNLDLNLTLPTKCLRADTPKTKKIAKHPLSQELFEREDITPPNRSPPHMLVLPGIFSWPNYHGGTGDLQAPAPASWQKIGCATHLHQLGYGTDHYTRTKDQGGGLWEHQMRMIFWETIWKIWNKIVGDNLIQFLVTDHPFALQMYLPPAPLLIEWAHHIGPPGRGER